MRARLLREDGNGDVIYTGPLLPAQRLARRDRFDSSQYVEDRGAWLVELCDDPEWENVAEWGGGETEEEAWRYALGALFGPLDDAYDEAGLWTWLQLCSDPNPIPPSAAATSWG